jgi:hypothetical protein
VGIKLNFTHPTWKPVLIDLCVRVYLGTLNKISKQAPYLTVSKNSPLFYNGLFVSKLGQITLLLYIIIEIMSRRKNKNEKF